MKSRVLTLILLSIIFITTQASAKTGLSLGVFGSHVTDNSGIEKAINDRIVNGTGSMDGTDFKRDTLIITGPGFYARYIFANNLFVRGGVEYYQMVSGGGYPFYSGMYMTDVDAEYRYMAIALPLLFGINATPDKGRTYIYAAAGMVFAGNEISFNERYYNAGSYEIKSETKTFIYGFGAVFGIEKKIFQNISIMIEYALYKCEKDKSASAETYSNGALTNSISYLEKCELPRQQVRFGAGYEF